MQPPREQAACFGFSSFFKTRLLSLWVLPPPVSAAQPSPSARVWIRMNQPAILRSLWRSKGRLEDAAQGIRGGGEGRHLSCLCSHRPGRPQERASPFALPVTSCPTAVSPLRNDTESRQVRANLKLGRTWKGGCPRPRCPLQGPWLKALPWGLVLQSLAGRLAQGFEQWQQPGVPQGAILIWS